jgi:pyroglutamyl-peptidase
MDIKSKVVLVTAFEPFGDSDVNASESILRTISVPSAEVKTGILPVRKNSVHSTLNQLISDYSPDAIVLLGEAGPEEVVRLELVALNHDDFRMPDNDGHIASPSRIIPDAPAAYFSNIDVHSLNSLVPTDENHSSATVSLSAGSFLCNHTYFVARHFHHNIPALFIHIPCLRDETHEMDAFTRVSNTVNCIVQEITATLEVSPHD